MIERLPFPFRQILNWQRQRFFREENWLVEGAASAEGFTLAFEEAADNRLPLLMTLPKFRFNRQFVGRIRDNRIAVKHRTHPLIWPIGPGSYYFTGRMETAEGGGISVAGGYRLRPTLAIMYYVYLTLGFGFLGISLVATLAGAGLWIWLGGADARILLSGLKMLGISLVYLALGWGHISFEKWLDSRNRRAVLALLRRAAGAA